jgi:hypothetical protein
LKNFSVSQDTLDNQDRYKNENLLG